MGWGTLVQVLPVFCAAVAGIILIFKYNNSASQENPSSSSSHGGGGGGFKRRKSSGGNNDDGPSSSNTTRRRRQPYSGDETCTICLEDLFGEREQGLYQDVRCLPCMHIFHSDCLFKWLKVPMDVHQCPVCRVRIDDEFLKCKR